MLLALWNYATKASGGNFAPFVVNHGQRNNDMNIEWQPIKTAPKDETRVLLWCSDSRSVECGYWSTSLWVTRPEGSILGAQKGAWIIYEQRSDTLELNPSHWMPLPEPPK